MKRHVAILVFDEVEVLDFAGPFEVFSVAGELGVDPPLQTFTLSLRPGTVRARNGLKVVPDFTFEHCPAPNVIVIPGGAGTRPLLQMPALLEWLRLKARTAEMVMSVCTGALVLGRAGLLEGLTATTHHDCLDELRQVSPNITVVPNQRFIDHGTVLTAAGISAGIDASLHVVGRLYGAAAAAATAQYMEYRQS